MGGGLEFRFSFHTTRYNETVEFYKDKLGLPVVKTWNRGFNDSGHLFQAASGLIVVLQSASRQVEPLTNAVILVQVDDLDKYLDVLKQRGVEVVQAVQKREWGDRDFKVSDPNGLVIGFYSHT